MRHIFFSLLLPFLLVSVARNVLAAEYQSSSTQHHHLTFEPSNEKFYTEAGRLVQRQIDLIARIEQALTNPDANRMRAVGGQLTVQVKTVENFLHRQHKNSHTLCSNQADLARNLVSLPDQLTESQAQIYCSLYASSQELLKLTPVLDRLLSRRGELALVRQLPLVTGEHQSDPVLSMAPMQYPHLRKLATPFSTWEPKPPTAASAPLPVIGRTAKTAIANYVPPVQPAIAAPESSLTTLATAKQILTATQTSFPPEIRFTDPWENATILDRFAYDLDPQESQTYAKFLELPRTGIFRVLQSSAYRRPLNTLRNRLQPSVNERYPFPSLGDAQKRFNPSLALQVQGERFQLRHPGVDYSFMVDLGDVPLEKLDGKLQTIDSPMREFLLNYQPPQKLDALQLDRRRFLSGKDQNWQQNQTILAHAPAKLNHTYVVRSLQFQIPEKMLNGQPISQDQLQQVHSSDIILAFRPVRRRRDGSYTVLWRVLNQLPTPQIEQ
ncbi:MULTISPECIES: hypothetical protein [unclassified Anabaena]|uniref:hypothetical protein n=1 Tax=unclassified Anabaena TaxID=2619674 RepID=UPI0039C5C3C7